MKLNATHIEGYESCPEGDLIALKDGTMIVISEDAIGYYKSYEAFWNAVPDDTIGIIERPF